MIPKYHRTVLIVFDLAMDFFNFGTSQLEQQIEAATDEKLNEPNWGDNMLIVDLIASEENGPRDGVRGLRKRMAHRNPKVGLLALTVIYYLLHIYFLIESCRLLKQW